MIRVFVYAPPVAPATTSLQMFSSKSPSGRPRDGDSSTVSLPAFEVVSAREGTSPGNPRTTLKGIKGRAGGGMQEAHRSGRKSKAHSKHDHKCHKAKHKSTESLAEGAERRGGRNYLSRRRPAGGALPPDSELLSPFEVNVGLAYRHVKTDNGRLREHVERLLEEKQEMGSTAGRLARENEDLRGDLSLMKVLVFKLNLELEKYQTGGKAPGDGDKKPARLPSGYEKNFLKPVLPLLKAYGEALQEKDDTIAGLESEHKRFNAAFDDLLRENEKLYLELEKKILSLDGGAFDQVRAAKKDLEVAKQENDLLLQQIKLEREKLAKVHSALKVKVEELSRDKEDALRETEECRAELYLLRGRHSVLKQEFDRVKLDQEARLPLAVHSASIEECRKLFRDLKNEYENEKRRLVGKIAELEGNLARQARREEEWAAEKNSLEKSNFNQSLEMETLRRKVSELENQPGEGGRSLTNERGQRELLESKKQLREANRRVDELSAKLSATRKQLQKAMMFAEDIVRGQEGLLLQLHAKQTENRLMTTQFGSLKTQLKDVGKGAREDLVSIEEKIRSLEAENYTLAVHNRKLEKLLAEKEGTIGAPEPAKE